MAVRHEIAKSPRETGARSCEGRRHPHAGCRPAEQRAHPLGRCETCGQACRSGESAIV